MKKPSSDSTGDEYLHPEWSEDDVLDSLEEGEARTGAYNPADDLGLQSEKLEGMAEWDVEDNVPFAPRRGGGPPPGREILGELGLTRMGPTCPDELLITLLGRPPIQVPYDQDQIAHYVVARDRSHGYFRMLNVDGDMVLCPVPVRPRRWPRGVAPRMEEYIEDAEGGTYVRHYRDGHRDYRVRVGLPIRIGGWDPAEFDPEIVVHGLYGRPTSYMEYGERAFIRVGGDEPTDFPLSHRPHQWGTHHIREYHSVYNGWIHGLLLQFSDHPNDYVLIGYPFGRRPYTFMLPS